ncbi:YggS family pyridoxal phosphate-dependent enzyme [Halobacteriovorax sp. GB3]|uniref:YggS family pyridoxal phosphate-dependent enzyme n=1 Tax=Halobacteriovorax sp. GB3 TaxID=2719615 RepID=UPI002362E8D5|nr:YggS family pyridoxal phosphate-dependent enzyme [Halobacteriovorax sp. GB3]MDD0853067.1 YggS family pyridoxal phosphate-dependent enzyme [Halobacteriovorax sp. GB3]
MSRRVEIGSNLEIVNRRIENTKSMGKDVCLVAVTKYSKFHDIQLAYDAGHRDFGENRVSDLLEKAEMAEKEGLHDINWHFIGNLQSNKVKKLFGLLSLRYIHSVDSKKLLETLHQRKDDIVSSNVSYFLQVNTSAEEEKSGLQTYDELADAVNYALKFDGGTPLKLAGLMTMGKIRTDDFRDDASKCFKKLVYYKKLLERDFPIKLKLSMGMSNDFDLALKEGADFIRVGSKIFKSNNNS